jgi:hypothetical protein
LPTGPLAFGAPALCGPTLRVRIVLTCPDLDPM